MTVKRRTLLVAAGLGGLPAWALAQAAAKDAAVAEALFVEGKVDVLQWADPQPHLVLSHVPRQVPKGELPARRIRSSVEPLALRALLDRVLVIPGAGPWRVHLPALARLTQWGLQAPQVGQVVGVLGVPIPQVAGVNTVSAQVLFLDDGGYPVLFDPA